MLSCQSRRILNNGKLKMLQTQYSVHEMIACNCRFSGMRTVISKTVPVKKKISDRQEIHHYSW